MLAQDWRRFSSGQTDGGTWIKTCGPHALAGTKLLGMNPVSARLVLFTPLLFTETLTREGFLGPTPLPRLHVVAVLLDLLDDVFRLNLPLEATESVFQRLTLLNDNFCHAYFTPVPFLK